jgi:hypothetical protein
LATDGFKTGSDEYFPPKYTALAKKLHEEALFHQLNNLSASECIAAYGKAFQSDRQSLLLVVADTETSILGWIQQEYSADTIMIPVADATIVFEADADIILNAAAGNPQPNNWVCKQNVGQTPCTPNEVLELQSNASGWQPFGRTIQYCLSQPSEQHCELQFFRSIAIVAIIANAMKTIVLGFLVFGMRDLPILTVGDAVASFLKNPDIFTKDMCLLSKRDFNGNLLLDGVPRMFEDCRERWYRAVSGMRWLISALL